MVRSARFAVIVIILSCCISLFGMGQQYTEESFSYTIEHESLEEIKLFVEAYGSQIDHQTWCVGLHKAIVRGDLEVVAYIIAQGHINVATENIGSYYKTGNKPLMALDVVQFMLDNAHDQDDASCYAAIKAYIHELAGDQNDEASLLVKRHCSYKNKTSWLLAGSLFCWLLYCVTMYSKGTVSSA